MNVENHQDHSFEETGAHALTAEMVALAADRLHMSVEEARSCARPIPGLADAYLFSPPGRGEGRLIVSSDLQMLWVASSVSPMTHIKAFRCGFRS